MRHLRSVLCAMSVLSVGCLASEPLHPVATTTLVVLGPTPSAGPTAPMEVATSPFGSTQEQPGMLRGEVFALPENTHHLPDFSELRPIATLFAHEVNIAPRSFSQGFPGVPDRVEWFGVRYNGTFRVASAGQYRFRVLADDGARLVIDGHTVISNDGIHPPTWGEGAVPLSAGEHRVVVEYFQGPRFDIALQVFWTRPGGQETLFRVDG